MWIFKNKTSETQRKYTRWLTTCDEVLKLEDSVLLCFISVVSIFWITYFYNHTYLTKPSSLPIPHLQSNKLIFWGSRASFIQKDRSSSRWMVLDEWMNEWMYMTCALPLSWIVSKKINERMNGLDFASERSTKDDSRILGLSDGDGCVIIINWKVRRKPWLVKFQTWWISDVGHQQCPGGR